MSTLLQKRYLAQATYEPARTPLNFSENTINERLNRLLYERSPDQQEEFWNNLQPYVLAGIKEQVENLLEIEAQRACGGLRSYEHPQDDEVRLGYRSGHYTRELQTTLGLIGALEVPKIRKRAKGSPRGWKVLRAYKRHRVSIDDLIKDVFLAGVATRRVHEVLKPILGRLYSAQKVSMSLKKLQVHVNAFHDRPLSDDWDYLFFDGLTIKIRLAGKVRKKMVLVARGLKVNDKGQVIRQEIIDYMFTKGESAAAWESFVHHLYDRGIKGKNLGLIATDGNQGLLNALDLVYPRTPKQRCWAHKMRNVANKCRVKYQALITDNAKEIYRADSKKQAVKAFQRFKDLCKPIEPEAVKCIEKDLPELLHFYDQPAELRKKLRTTNSIERSFREVRRRIRTISVFSNEPSCDRIIYGVITRLNELWRRRSLKEFANKC